MADGANAGPGADTAAVDEQSVQAALDAALAAVAAAADPDQLRAARLAHAGDRSPLALANRQIGSLDKSQKSAAGKLVGQARGRVNQAVAARTTVLEEERDARILVEEAVDVTAAYLALDTPGPDRTQHAEKLARSAADTAERHGLPVVACQAWELLATVARERDPWE